MDQLFSLSADVQQLIIRSEVPPDVSAAIVAAHETIQQEMGPDVRVSLRSSAPSNIRQKPYVGVGNPVPPR